MERFDVMKIPQPLYATRSRSRVGRWFRRDFCGSQPINGCALAPRRVLTVWASNVAPA